MPNSNQTYAGPNLRPLHNHRLEAVFGAQIMGQNAEIRRRKFNWRKHLGFEVGL